MKKFFKILLIVGVCCTLVGGGVFCCGLAAANWDVDALGNVTLENQFYTETAETEITELAIDFQNADIKVEFSAEAETVQVIYPLSSRKDGQPINRVQVEAPSESVPNVLKITEHMDGWNSILWNFTDPVVTLTLPAARTYSLSLKTDNGNVVLAKGSCTLTELSMETKNGNIEINTGHVSCKKEINLSTDNGNIFADKFTADKFIAETDNGNIALANTTCIATQEVSLETDNGDIVVSGTLTSERIHLETDNGDIQAHVGLLIGSNVTLSTDVGDVKATLFGTQAEYATTVEDGIGSSNIVGDLGSVTNAERSLTVKTEVGDIEIFFKTAE